MTGFANKWAALIGLVCLAAAIVAAPAQASHARINNISCTPSYTTVTCTFNTSPATKASMAEGTDWKNMVSVAEGRKHTKHRLSFKGLEPGVQYDAKIQAGGSSAKTTFATLGPATASPPTVKTNGRYWTLNSGRFVPTINYSYLYVGCLSASEVATTLATGAKLVLVDKYGSQMTGCGSSQDDQINLMHQALGEQMWWNYFDPHPLAPSPGQTQLAEVLGWPALTNDSSSGPNGMYSNGYLPAWQESFLVKCPDSGSWRLHEYLQLAMARGPQLSGILLGSTYSFSQFPENSCESPVRVTNEFWTSVSLGAGVAWDEWANQVRKPALFSQLPRLVSTAGRLSLQLATVAPVLLYGHKVTVNYISKRPLGAVLKPNGWNTAIRPVEPIRVSAWRYGNRIYLLAVNVGGVGENESQWFKSHPTTVSVKVANLVGGSARSLWGSKGLKLKGSTASIHLPAIGTSWYVITPKK